MVEWDCSPSQGVILGTSVGCPWGGWPGEPGGWSEGKGWFSWVWGSVKPTCSPWAELPHRLTMETLVREKHLIQVLSLICGGSGRQLILELACLLNGVIAGRCQRFRLFPGRGRRKEGCHGPAERGPLQAVSEVTEGALAGEPRRVRGRGNPRCRAGPEGPPEWQVTRSPFYQWEDQGCPREGAHPESSRAAQPAAWLQQTTRHPPRWLCSHPSHDPLSPCRVPLAGACARQSPLFLSLAAGDQRGGGVTEASSLLGLTAAAVWPEGLSYHTGQLHPVALVADLLQHINQVKTAEGCGFKQDKGLAPSSWDPSQGPPLAPSFYTLPPGCHGGNRDGGCKGSGALGLTGGTTVTTPAVIIIPSSGQVGCSRTGLTCHHPGWTPSQSSTLPQTRAYSILLLMPCALSGNLSFQAPLSAS